MAIDGAVALSLPQLPQADWASRGGLPEVFYALKSQERNTSQGNGNYVTAFHATQDPISGDISPAMGKEESGSIAVAYALRRDPGGTGQGHNTNYVQAAQTVRRLTPTECERLQALPDGWTNPDGQAPDSRRYAGLGDAVTASVGEWIGRRIIEAT